MTHHDAGAPLAAEKTLPPEMIEAGAAVIFEHRDILSAWSLAEAVYRAMRKLEPTP